MEACTINLNQTADKGRRFKRFILILTLIFLASAAAVAWILYQKHDMETWVFISLGIYFLFFLYFGYIGYKIVLPILSTTIGYFLVDLLLLNAFLNLGAGSVKSGLGYARACGATCLLLTGSEPKLFLHLR